MTIQNKLVLSSNDIFAIYRLPKTNEIIILKQNESKKILFNESCLNKKGFVFYPFDENKNIPLFIKADEVYLNKEFSFFPIESKSNKNISKVEYLEKASHFIKAIKTNFRKIVLSRTKTISKNNEDLFLLFSELEDKYKDAMIFLVNIPNVGTWMGATPERLLKYKKYNAKTLALAGTQFVKNIKSASWESKEIEEQKAVMDYIENTLCDFNFDFQVNGPYTKIAAENKNGTLIHLATDYSFNIKNNLFKFITKLHPTPAVSGFPKKESINYILKNEGYNREYYTGFLGPINIINDDTLNLFVNLRSMKVFKNEYLLFLGGGLNSGSDPLKEWEETENKARTLEDIII